MERGREVIRKTTYDFNLNAFLVNAEEFVNDKDPYNEDTPSDDNNFCTVVKRLSKQLFFERIGEDFFEINSESDIKMFADAIMYWPTYYNEDEEDLRFPLIEQIITDEMMGEAIKVKSKKKVFI